MTNTKRAWKEFVQDALMQHIADFEVVPRSTALLIIDMQKYMCCRDVGLGPTIIKETPEVAEYWFWCISKVVVPNIQRLLKFFRSNKIRITYACVGPLLPDASDMIPRRRIWDQNRLRVAGINHFFYPGTLEREIIDELKPQEGEIIFNKNSGNAFNSTNIDQILKNMGIDSLVITGMATNVCVEITARDAADRGYNCILVDDACACKNQDAHEMTMINFARAYGKVMTTREVIGYLRSRLHGIGKQESFIEGP